MTTILLDTMVTTGSIMADDKPTTRVFINHLDSYSGRSISKIFASSVIGATLQATDDDEVASLDSKEDVFPKENCYEVVGTVLNPNSPKPEWVQEILHPNSNEELFQYLLDCDIILYDICSGLDQVDEASWAMSALHAEMEHFPFPKCFICLSTVMTWAKSKPIDPDDKEMPFTEEDYTKRKPHSNFKAHISCEKLCIKLGKSNKSKYMTYVISSGFTYGAGEDLFHCLFKSAWHGRLPSLPCYGDGQNILPTIHIKDLASVLVNVADEKPKRRYLVAVDDAKSTLEDIVKAVSNHLGNGKTKYTKKEEALLNKEFDQSEYDRLLVDLRIDATYAKEAMNIKWEAESGLPQTIVKIVKEYKTVRGLKPLCVCIVGAPATGKSMVAIQLCEHYKLHHIRVQGVINDAIEGLEKSAARASEEGDGEDDIKAQDDQELLDSLEEDKKQNNGRYSDQYIVRFFKDKLHSMPCQNQGFVLDGFPKSYDQAKELFSVEEEENDIESDENAPKYDATIIPEFVISLDAPDDFLNARVMNLPEAVVSGTHNTEDGMLRRLAEYRSFNTEDETMLNYFDEYEIHPEHYDVTLDSSSNMKTTVEHIFAMIGKPRNYGPTKEELAELERIEVEKRIQTERQEKDERERRETEEAQRRAEQLDDWRSKMRAVKMQESELLETRSIPLRNYLMKHVMPTVTQGLVECCKIRPDDPVDFLAEYLFEHNPGLDE